MRYAVAVAETLSSPNGASVRHGVAKLQVSRLRRVRVSGQ